MKQALILTFLALALLLPACGKSEEKQPEIKFGHAVVDERAVDKGPVNLGQPQDKPSGPAKSGAYQGLDPAKVEKLSPEARRTLERDAELAKKAKDQNMSGAEFMKAASGGELPKPPKF